MTFQFRLALILGFALSSSASGAEYRGVAAWFSGTRVAYKTGELPKVHHDAAIVYAPRPFVLVILVCGLAESKESAALMADITRRIYESTQ
jgi:hypothetical protein